MQELGVLHRCWEAPGKNIITSLEQLVDVISTFRSAVVEDALFSLKKTEEARIEWCTMHEGLSKQMNSSNAGTYKLFFDLTRSSGGFNGKEDCRRL